VSLAILIVLAFIFTPKSKSQSPAPESPPKSTGPAASTPDPALQWAECMDRLSNRETAVYETLSGTNQYTLMTALRSPLGEVASCNARKKLLDALAQYPRDQRDEIFAGILDRMEGRN
jgi:hypothetical protein